MKNLILVALLLLTVSAMSFAQINVQQTANATATVVASATMTKLTDLTFPPLLLGSAATIAANTAQAASFAFSGAGSTPTTVAVTFPGNLTSGSNNLPFSAGTVRTNVVAAAGTSVVYTVPTNTTAAGALWIYTGGTVTADVAQAAGQYTGLITVTVTQ